MHQELRDHSTRTPDAETRSGTSPFSPRKSFDQGAESVGEGTKKEERSGVESETRGPWRLVQRELRRSRARRGVGKERRTDASQKLLAGSAESCLMMLSGVVRSKDAD